MGGGLAGCFHAAASATRGHRVTLVDAPRPKAASRVAAGLFNVFTGREANKTWMADDLLATIDRFLSRPEFMPLRSHFHFMPIYRPFPDARSYNDWMVKLQHPGYARLASHHPTPKLAGILHNPLGGLQVNACGWVEVAPLCSGILSILEARYGLRHVVAEFEHGRLDPDNGAYDGPLANGTYDEVVFAEGLGIAANPWFDFVEIRPLKGQIIDIRMAPGLDEGEVVIRKSFIIPKGNDFYTVGSTYEAQFEDEEPSETGIESLRRSVEAMVALPFEVVAARAALRPTTANRRPVLGRHPLHPRLAVLNGMGTKGVLQAPLMAELLRELLDGERSELPPEVGLERFLKKFA